MTTTNPNAEMPAVKQVLHADLQPLDRQAHKGMRLARQIQQDYSPARGMNSLFLTAVEFFDAAREYPIVFVRTSPPQADNEAPKEVLPLAVLGLARGENLFLGADNSWKASYVPAHLRAYPFAMAQMDDQQYIICYDKEWSGFSEKEGELLFSESGEPTEFMQGVQKYLETLDVEVQRTRTVGQKLLELELLTDMRFDATLPDGKTIQVDGFLAIDENKFAALSDEAVLDLHRSGILALISAQLISMGNMRRLVERRIAQGSAA